MPRSGSHYISPIRCPSCGERTRGPLTRGESGFACRLCSASISANATNRISFGAPAQREIADTRCGYATQPSGDASRAEA